MKIIIGLGNPGTEYALTRHNVGWLFVDYLAQQANFSIWHTEDKFLAQIATGQINQQKVILVQPLTFMNLSGESVRRLVDFYKISIPSDLIIAYDDLDLALGQYKITQGIGPHSHNGLLSIYHCLGETKDFCHLRLGTDGRDGARDIPALDYVLTPFSSQEKTILTETFARATADLEKKAFR